MNLGNLRDLQWLNFAGNLLGSNETNDLRFLTSLANCTNLRTLHLNGNQHGGNLPDSIANLSSELRSLRIDENHISGGIPEGIGKLANLVNLALNRNMLNGSIPNSVGELPKLQGIDISRNKLSGTIPPTIGNITLLSILDMRENSLQGSIPNSMGSYKYLQRLDLSNNKLTGAIPEEVISLSSLSIGLNLSHNHLDGSLPIGVGRLVNLGKLDISNNKLSGYLPSSIGECQVLELLNVQGNYFKGAIPESLHELRGIEVLDLSHNNFSGPIPRLGHLPFIRHLDISFNMFEGEVPNEFLFSNLSAFLFSGNEKLCGGTKILNLPECPKKTKRKPSSSEEKTKRKLSALKVVIILTGITFIFLMFLAHVCATLYWTKNFAQKNKPLESPIGSHDYPRISYAELVQATDGFSRIRLIGRGRYSCVYMGTLGASGQVVALKVLDLGQSGATKSFVSECEALRNIRHRNIVKIITTCSGIDFKGNDFKALVFDFMPSGSLESWLHASPSMILNSMRNSKPPLSLIQRLNIAIDVASALTYLHHQCETPIVHCDLKPSNIFLDNELCAHVGDFGLARFLSATTEKANHRRNTSLGITGTIGYLALEYGLGGAVSTQGDVYSYGILLLEIFIRKRPTDNMFGDNLSLHHYARMAFPDRVMKIVDPILVLDVRDNSNTRTNQGRVGECLNRFFELESNVLLNRLEREWLRKMFF